MSACNSNRPQPDVGQEFLSRFRCCLVKFAAMIQQGVIIALFAGALFYLGRPVWRSFQSKKMQQPGCAKCMPTEKVTN